MRHKLTLICIIIFLVGCTLEVDVVSTASLVEEEQSVVVIKKAEDIVLKELSVNLDNHEGDDNIKLVFNTYSDIVLTINDASLSIGTDLEHMVKSESNKRSKYDLKVVDNKLFVINEYDDNHHNGIKIKCYEYDGLIINEVWSSKSKIRMKMTDSKLIVNAGNYNEALDLDDESIKRLNAKESKSCGIKELLVFTFEDLDGDGHEDLYLESRLEFSKGFNKSFYHVYNLSESVELIDCGFVDQVKN